MYKITLGNGEEYLARAQRATDRYERWLNSRRNRNDFSDTFNVIEAEALAASESNPYGEVPTPKPVKLRFHSIDSMWWVGAIQTKFTPLTE